MAVADARAARERKQKIFVVVGGVVLLGLLAFQLPKLLGGSSSPSATPTVETTTQGTTGAPTPQSSPAPASLSGSNGRLAPAPGKLGSFTLFDRKDPFVQQISAPSPAAETAPKKTDVEKGEKKEPASKGFTVGGTSPAAIVTVISVNGARQALEPGVAFPAGDPMFVLVAEQPGAEAVVIGVAGGAYAGGAQTTRLKVGKPLVLVNTTTGARYRLVLVAVGSGESAASKASPTQPATP